MPEHFLKPSSEISVSELTNQEQLLINMSPSKSLPLRSVDTVSQLDNYRKISNISNASTDSAYTSDTNMTYKQLTDINQVQNMVEAVPETYVQNGSDTIYQQEALIYQNVDPVIQDASTFIPNNVTQWNYQIQNAIQNQPPPPVEEELQRKISTVSTVSNLSSLSSDSVQGLVQLDIQHHAIILEENALQNNQNVYVQNQEGINVNQPDSLNYCKAQSPSSETYLLNNLQPYQENQVCLNYNQINHSDETTMTEENILENKDLLANTVDHDVKQNLR